MTNIKLVNTSFN